ncbi:hypothetical protein QTP70_018070 [Hemibagrus guttatus]|uniref:Uncharacterized protein n=1 Tax=Hemibagrus guttatus TaxID=175788 RepID=A0AAE0V8S1_9TELE|nr:hypothetical protein QTP70_018070 [Hemibagrus guttatus]
MRFETHERCRNKNKAAVRKLLERFMRGFCRIYEKMFRCCGILLILALSLQSEGNMDTKQLSAGHVFILNCDVFSEDDKGISVNWTREPKQDWDAGQRVINQSLWFFPAQASHSGNYSCYFSDRDGPSEMHFSISVTKHECPPVSKTVFLYKNRHHNLDCDSKVKREITHLSSASIVSWTWMKDCRPLNRNKNSPIIRFQPISEGDKGVYTCVMNFTLNGTSYTEAQSIQVMPTDPGSKQVLHCKVFVGPGSCQTDRVTSVYWLLNNSFIEKETSKLFVEKYCTTENNVEYQHSNLTIFKVQEEFFNIPFRCVVLNSYGYDNGTILLIPSSERMLYVTLGVFTVFAVVALSFLVFYRFKVDLVLAYRSVSPCLKELNDGKLYDAYVSYLHGDDHTVSSATTFTLCVLPEVLEDRFGYKLFISDRDTYPGTAIPDAISETVGKSRRLIIVLTPEAFTNTSENEAGLLNKMPTEHRSLNNNITATDPNQTESSRPNWGPYECWVGLYDALVKECLQVILVQVGGDVDEALLPESLRYVKHTQGILKWKQHYAIKPNRRFWKQMRYRMPPVQKARHGFMV